MSDHGEHGEEAPATPFVYHHLERGVGEVPVVADGYTQSGDDVDLYAPLPHRETEDNDTMGRSRSLLEISCLWH